MIETTRFNQIGIIGSGQMGSGIAQVCATHGFKVFLNDTNPNSLEKAKSSIETSLNKLVSKGLLPVESPKKSLDLIDFVTDLNSLKNCDLAIEAIHENIDAKGEILRKLDEIMDPAAVIGTNTSSISITKLASYSLYPERVIGIHFMNPVPLINLVEIINGLKTSPGTLAKTLLFCKNLSKETIRSDDYPGFVINRILMPMINEAFEVLREGIATAEDIDRGMKQGTNQPMGPIALADFIGLDTCLSILEVLHRGLGDPKYRPSPLLQKYVNAGLLGRKTKQGVYTY